MMTPRERWLAILNNEKPDRITTDYWATSEVTDRLLKDLACADYRELCKKLHIDSPHVIGAPLLQDIPIADDGTFTDIWGVTKRMVDYGSGEYDEAVTHPLENAETVDDIHAHKWPDPAARDYDDFVTQVDSAPSDRLVRCGSYEPFLLYCFLRGMENAMIDLYLNPDIADAVLTHLFDYHYEVNKRMFELGKDRIELTYIAEDLGSQHGLLMSKELIHRFILPNQKKMVDLARSFDIHIFYHTDGAARDIIPDLIDVTGIEILNPIQWRCPGMEREGLVKDFGDKVIFHGAVDNQHTLAFGSPDDVRQEVLDNIRIFAPPARWICAPCHNIQPVSPTENIVAMYETIYEHGILE